MTPFVKWAGGKRQLIKKIDTYLPKEINTYYEPFVGGGALFFHLRPEKAVINDMNSELIASYKVIRNKYTELVEWLEEHKREHSEKHFSRVREVDRQKIWLKKYSDTYIAARFMYLNKAGFNGLYRVNSKGQFNVPSGKKEFVTIYDLENLKEIHAYLKNNKISIRNGDYKKCVTKATSGDFVYFDPPYDKWDASTFTKYQKNDFDRMDQQELADLCKKLDGKGVKWMVSNHNTDFIREIFKDFNVKVVQARRSINSKGSKRGPVEEVIITNY